MAKNIFNRLGEMIETQVETNVSQASKPYFGGYLGPSNVNPLALDELNDPISKYSAFNGRFNASYSGSDCTCFIQLNNKIFIMGNVETFSYSIHREKSPVRVLGRSHPKGFTAGGRTIAGSIVFVTFDRAPLWDLIQEINHVRNPSDRNTSPLPDQLPPLDLILLFHNEYGHHSITRLYGVEFVDEGTTHSINDLYSECIMQYVARDMDQMIAFKEVSDFKNMMFERMVRGNFIDNQFAALMDYQQKLQTQIAECNSIIDGIDMETNRRDFALVNTAANAWNWAFKKSYSNPDQRKLDDEKKKQLKIKNNLLKELEKVNALIEKKQKEIKGWNAQKSDLTGNQSLDATRTSTPVQ